MVLLGLRLAFEEQPRLAIVISERRRPLAHLGTLDGRREAMEALLRTLARAGRVKQARRIGHALRLHERLHCGALIGSWVKLVDPSRFSCVSR